MIVKTVVMTVDRSGMSGGEGKNDRDGRKDDVEGDGGDGDRGSRVKRRMIEAAEGEWMVVTMELWGDGMVMTVVAEAGGEADSSTPLGPGLLTPTSGPYESQQVVSSSRVDYILLPPALPIISAVTSQE